MIYFPASNIERSTEAALSSTAILADEGQAMVSTLVNGKAYMAPATGAAGERFVGFSLLTTSGAPVLPTTAIKVEEFTVPVSGIVVASLTPLASTTVAYEVANGANVAVVSVTGNSIDLAAANAGKLVRVTYRYTLTAVQAQALSGNAQPGGYSGALLGQVGLHQQGVIYTTHFSSGINFAAATAIKLDVNGRVTDQTGAGTAINAFVEELPTVDRPYLGLRFAAV